MRIIIVTALILTCITNVQVFSQVSLGKQNLEGYFIENKGQWPDEVLYLTSLNGLDAWITKDGICYDFYSNEVTKGKPEGMSYEKSEIMRTGHVVRVWMNGCSNNVTGEGKEKRQEYFNYFIGTDKSKYRSEVPLYNRVVVKNIYQNIDQVYYFDNGMLRYDFILKPGASISDINMKFEGTENVILDEKGEIVFKTRFGNVSNGSLFAYQEVSNAKKQMNSSFVLNSDASVSIISDWKDMSKPLVIDPLLVYFSTFIGTTGDDYSNSVALRPNNNIVITGYTNSQSFPHFTGSYGNLSNINVFVSEFEADGTNLVFSSFVGGVNDDFGKVVKVDNSGSILIAGSTWSAGTFPFTSNSGPALGACDAFVTKLNNTGTSIIFSTVIGGSGVDDLWDMEIDNNFIYLAGETNSNSSFPLYNAADVSMYLFENFIIKIPASGAWNPVYSSYWGGDSNEKYCKIAVDNAGYLYLTGNTSRTDHNIYSSVYGVPLSINDNLAFVSRFGPNGAHISSVAINGSLSDAGKEIMIEQSGNVVVSGNTYSNDLPATNGSAYSSNIDAFICKINISGMTFLSYYGGNNIDEVISMTQDAMGCTYITGYTLSSNLPVVSHAYLNNTSLGSTDAFIVSFNNSGELHISTYIGGSDFDAINGIAIRSDREMIITGNTQSVNYPHTSIFNPLYDDSYNGSTDGFVTRLAVCPTDFADATALTPSLCDNGTIVLHCNGGVSYSWTGPNGYTSNLQEPVIFPISTAYSGTYNVVATDAGGCTSTDAVAVSVGQAPVAVITGPSGVCFGQSATLTASGGTSYLWNTGATTQSITVTPTSTTTYSVVVYNSNGCSDTESKTVINYKTPASVINSVNEICQGESVTLTASGGVFYLWSTGATTSSITVTPSATTTYSVVVTTSVGCSSSSSKTITVKPRPVVTVSPGVVTICSGQSATLTASGGGTYLWNTGATSASITVTPPLTTNYTVVVTGSNQCTKSASKSVTVRALPNAVITPSPAHICQGNTATLTASGGVSYSWSNGSSGSVINVSPSTNTSYSCIVTNGGGCTKSVSAIVEVHPYPAQFGLMGGGVFCTSSEGTEIRLLGSENSVTYTLYLNGVPTAYSINGTGNSLSFSNITDLGTYTVVATNAWGCSSTMLNSVYYDHIDYSYLLPGGTYCDGTNGLELIMSNSQPGVSYRLYNMSTPVTPVSSIIQGTGGPVSFGYHLSGSYRVKVESPCFQFMDEKAIVTNINCTKMMLDEKDKSDIVHVYPNPSNGSFSIDYYKPATFILTDVSGKSITRIEHRENENSVIHVEGIAKGIYFLTSDEELIKPLKIIIE